MLPKTPQKTKITVKPETATSRDGLDFEVHGHEGHDEALQVLDEVVEAAQALGVLALLHVEQRANLGRRKRNVLVAQDDLELLPPIPIGLRPVLVILPACAQRGRRCESGALYAGRAGRRVALGGDRARRQGSAVARVAVRWRRRGR